MGRSKLINKEEYIEQEDKDITPEQQALSYLKSTKKDNYNFEEDNYYKVPSSSLNLNLELSGGLSVGAHRAIGINSGGKSSCSLDLMFNFLKLNKSNRGIYFNCEGRLTPELRSRSGIEFTTDPSTWNNNCLVVESNVYEVIFGFIRDVIINNPTKTKYFFIIDSMDNMAKRDDLSKPFEEAQQVSGGALLTSVFFKKTSLALSKRGHILIFVSQVRDEIKINQYQQSNPRQGKSSGGHSIEHNASVVMDFLPRYNDDLIRENPSDKNSKIIGHYCKVCLVKTDNEKNQVKLSYPIKYGRCGGNSVWKEMECVDMLVAWSHLKRKGEKGAWFYMDEDILKELKDIDAEFPEKFQGLDNVKLYLEQKPDLVEFLCKKYTTVLSN